MSYFYPGCKVRIRKDAPNVSGMFRQFLGAETVIIGRAPHSAHRNPFYPRDWWEVALKLFPGSNYIQAHHSVLEPIVPNDIFVQDTTEVKERLTA